MCVLRAQPKGKHLVVQRMEPAWVAKLLFCFFREVVSSYFVDLL